MDREAEITELKSELEQLRNENQSLKTKVDALSNIPNQKQTDAKTQHLEAVYKAFWHSPVLLGLSDMQTGEYLDVNKAFYETLELSKREVIGKRSQDIVGLDPNLRSEAVEKLKTDGNIHGLEATIFAKSGRKVHVLLSAETINSNGRNCIFTAAINITEQKEAESRVREGEDLLNTLYKTLPQLVWLKDANGVYLRCNRRFEKFFGARENEIIGQTDHDFVDKELADFFREKDTAALHAGGPTMNEERVVFAEDGHEEILETVKTPMHNSEGSLIGILGIGTNVTQRIQTENELKKQKQRLNDIIEGTNVGTWEWNIQTGETIFNERWAEMIGYTLDELKPVTIDTWLKFAHPEDLERSTELLDKHFNKEVEYYESECRMRHKDGSWIWVFDRGKVTQWDDQGKPLWMYGTHQEITQKKKDEQELIKAKEKAEESESRLLAFINSIPDIVCYKDGDGKWLLANPADLELFCLKDVDYIGKTDAELAVDTDPLYKEAFLRCMESDEKAWESQTITQGEERIPTTDGGIKIFDVYKIPLLHTTGERKGLAVVGRDITNLKKTEEELITAKDKAEEADRLKSAFLANMSHEIRTPMNAIVGFSQFLKDRNKPREALDKYAEIIQNSCNHLLRLINDIIDISKIDAGLMTLHIERINVNTMLDELYNIYRSELDSKRKYRIDLIKRCSKCNFVIETDETRFRQIFINLLSNAVKFTEYGSIEFGYEEKENGILFFVKDTGIGIPMEKQEHIFERFRQASTSTEKLYGGTGLGLAIAKACVELFEGKIWCESVHGQGTTMNFLIEANAFTSIDQTNESAASEEIQFNGEHIVIAEDDDINFEYLNEVFSDLEIKVERAVTGLEVVEKVKNNPSIKLVLMDIQMPSMTGIEATQEIRKCGIEIPIIAQTAYAFETDRRESIDAGCDEFLTKPTRPDLLREMVFKYLNAH